MNIHHPSYLTRSAAGLHPLTVHTGVRVMWAVAPCNGDARIMQAVGGILPPATG